MPVAAARRMLKGGPVCFNMASHDQFTKRSSTNLPVRKPSMSQSHSTLSPFCNPVSAVRREQSTEIQSAPSRAGIVTQEMLAAFQELTEVLHERDALRSRIVTMLNSGATVEAGPLTASVRISKQAYFSFDKLANLLGVDEAENLRDQIERTVRQMLIVARGISRDPAAGVLPQPPAAIAGSNASPCRPPRVEDYLVQEPEQRRHRR